MNLETYCDNTDNSSVLQKVFILEVQSESLIEVPKELQEETYINFLDLMRKSRNLQPNNILTVYMKP